MVFQYINGYTTISFKKVFRDPGIKLKEVNVNRKMFFFRNVEKMKVKGYPME